MAESKGLSLEEIKKESVDLVCFYSFFFVVFIVLFFVFVFVLSHNVFLFFSVNVFEEKSIFVKSVFLFLKSVFGIDMSFLVHCA